MSTGTRLYTWLDVESRIKKQKYDNWPQVINNIQVFADGVDVFLRDKNDEEEAKKFFSFLFGDWYDFENNLIYLESATKHPKKLHVFFMEDEVKDVFKSEDEKLNPFFSELALFMDKAEKQGSKDYIKWPSLIKDSPRMLAFYSLKGELAGRCRLSPP